MLPELLDPELPAQPKPLMMIDRYRQSRHGFFSQDQSALGPVQLVLDTCEILRSNETNNTKSLMLRPSTNLHDSLRLPGIQTTQQECPWFLQQLMKSGNPDAHYAAAFLVPLLGSELDEESIVLHILARSAVGVSGEWSDAIFKPPAEKSQYLSIWRSTLALVLGSTLSSEAKARALSIAGYAKGGCTYSVILAMAEAPDAFNRELGPVSNALIELCIEQIAASDLPPQLVNSLLSGILVSDKTQGKAIHSTAVLFAIANENVSFLSHYARCIGRAPLPEKAKLAMLSGTDPRRDNSEEVHQCIRKARPGILQRYRQEIADLPLTPESKQTLLTFFQ